MAWQTLPLCQPHALTVCRVMHKYRLLSMTTKHFIGPPESPFEQLPPASDYLRSTNSMVHAQYGAQDARTVKFNACSGGPLV